MSSSVVDASSRRVSFLVAGVQKGGTTALWAHLRHVPDLYMPERKEPHFFDDESVHWGAPDLEPYHHLFREAPEGALWGEATPIYIFWPQALERIRAYNPAMRLILIFRDPIERAISQWRMQITLGQETRPLSEALLSGIDWPGSEAPAEQRLRRYSYVERGLYGQQLERAMSLFPREQMLLLTSEALRNEAHGTLEQVARFLGVEPPRRLKAIRAYAGQGPAADLPEADQDTLRNWLVPDLLRFAALSGLDLSRWPTLGAPVQA